MNRFASFDGVAIAYDVLGDGPVVLLHHGFASSSRINWVRTGVAAAIVAAGYRVVLMDARGHGKSDKPHEPAAYANDAMVHDIQALLDVLAIDDADVVGYSLGAMVALALALIDPRTRSMVLGGAGLGQMTASHRGAMIRIAEALEASDRGTITDATGRAFRNFADATGADRRALAALQRAGNPAPTVEELGSIAIPTLVVNGVKDTLVGSPESLAAAIPHALYELVPGDHLSAVAKPEFRQAVVAFLHSL